MPTKGAVIGLGFDVMLAFGDRLDRLERVLLGMARDAKPERKWIRRNATAQAVAGVPTVLDLSRGGPGPGRMWDVRAIAVIGSDDHTNLAGTTVAIYLGEPSQVGLGDVYIPGASGGSGVTVPANIQFGEDQLAVIEPHHLYLVVDGAAAGQQLTAVAYGFEKPTGSVVDYTGRVPDRKHHHESDPAETHGSGAL